MRSPRNIAIALLVAGGALVPVFLTNAYYQQVIVDAYITAIAVYGLNVILGFGGQLSLGHAAFFGIGAYTVALLTTRTPVNFWIAMAIACVVTGTVGFLVGAIALRTRGNYFAIFTAAIGVMVNVVFTNWQWLTGGNIGIVGIPSPPPIGRISFDDPIPKYELVYAFLLLAIAATALIKRSLFGRALLAVASNEDLARAAGVDVTGVKRLAFVASTVLAGLAGGCYAMFVGFLGPETTQLDVTFNMLLFAIVGGLGTIAGPLVGTLLLSTTTQLLQSFAQYQMLVFGPLLVLLVMFLPSGIVGGLSRLRTRSTPVVAKTA